MVRLLIFDVLITAPLMTTWALLLHARDIVGVLALVAPLSLVRMSVWIRHMHLQLAPVRAYFERGRGSDAQLLAAEMALQRLPPRCTGMYSSGWMACGVLATAIAYVALPELLTIGVGELILALMWTLSVQWTLSLIAYPLLKLDVDPLRTELLMDARRRGLRPELRALSLTSRLRSQVLLMVLTPVVATSIIAWRAELDATRSAAMLDAITRAARSTCVAASRARAHRSTTVGGW